MSQTFFSKLDLHEKNNRLTQLGLSKGKVILWEKGKKEKTYVDAQVYHEDRCELVLNSKEDFFPANTKVLLSFDTRGMTFFTQGTFMKSIRKDAVIQILGELFKHEQRNAYRLLTYPQHDVNVEFDLGVSYQGGNVVDITTGGNTTNLFKKFLALVDNDNQNAGTGILRIRVQDISTTGMAIHVGELEFPYFEKGRSYSNVKVSFGTDSIIIPKAQIVYSAPTFSADKHIKKFKVGVHFPDVPVGVDDWIGKKINSLLRESDHNKDFEKFIR